MIASNAMNVVFLIESTLAVASSGGGQGGPTKTNADKTS